MRRAQSKDVQAFSETSQFQNYNIRLSLQEIVIGIWIVRKPHKGDHHCRAEKVDKMIVWTNIKDAAPPCDSETVFIGINTAGYCGCFNEHGFMSTAQGQRSVCLYATAEGVTEIMSDLEWWAEFDRPTK